MKVRDHFVDSGVAGRILLKLILGKYGIKVCTKLNCIRTARSRRLLVAGLGLIE